MGRWWLEVGVGGGGLLKGGDCRLGVAEGCCGLWKLSDGCCGLLGVVKGC